MTKTVSTPYRSRDEIYHDIITTVKAYEPEGARKIKILYGSRCSNDQLKAHLQDLMQAGLIIVDTQPGKRVFRLDYERPARRGDVYHLTDRGQKYMDIWKIQQELGVHI